MKNGIKIWAIVMSIFMVLLMVGGGLALYRAGWQGGFANGQTLGIEAAESVRSAASLPIYPPGAGLLGLFAGIILLLLALKSFFHITRMIAFRSIMKDFPRMDQWKDFHDQMPPFPFRKPFHRGFGPGHSYHFHAGGCGNYSDKFSKGACQYDREEGMPSEESKEGKEPEQD